MVSPLPADRGSEGSCQPSASAIINWRVGKIITLDQKDDQKVSSPALSIPISDHSIVVPYGAKKLAVTGSYTKTVSLTADVLREYRG
ncbi:uncharacterized protein PHALS_10855 [Plasmopara halstedii]|uniref:Uncharacterized protein n=1 Tax=Plasmopara halstedii TaxID=4781 RepID=A0A0P1AIE9_PLAHL|nr:uncharacterized protein PHALS_10855 [Plasmopara halstedii]CEG40669.1 hypothetical protein PHALS_10855 [Plasmopara halstedii]|eukprot:XP_024577038.1 hypothetical protein PHALS_10855 [Plasmopara halstedii]